MPIDSNFSSVFEKKWKIELTQCYPNGYLKHTELCNLFQLTAAAHSEMGGISFTDMQLHNQAWVLSRMRVEIEKMPEWKDEITIKTWIVNLEKSRSIRAIELYSNNKKIVGCETMWFVFNTEIRRPQQLILPNEHFIKYPLDRATAKEVKKINLPDHTDFVFHKTVLLSDIDIVNHVNNVKYLEWCLDFIDASKIISGKINSFDMNFTNELSLNDKIKIVQFDNLNTSTFTISSENKNCYCLEIKFDL